MLKRAQDKYNQSEKGKLAHKIWRQSEKGKAICKVHKDRWNKSEKGLLNSRNRAKRLRVKQRDILLGHYGGSPPKCACCGEPNKEFLAIDHIDGGGNRHRKIIKGGGRAFYQSLIRDKFPPGFRVLCHNCNQSFGLYDYCPHQGILKT